MQKRQIHPTFNPLTFPPRVVQANYYSFRANQSMGPQWDKSNLFILVNEGRGILRIGTEETQLEEGMICCIPWATPIHYSADAKKPFKILTLHLEYRPWKNRVLQKTFTTRVSNNPNKKQMEKPRYPQPFTELRFVQALTHSTLFNIASRVVGTFNTKESAQREALLRALSALFLEEYQHAAGSGEKPNDTHLYIKSAFHEMHYWLSFHFHEPLTAHLLAERAQMSYSSLSMLFRDKLGVSPMEHVMTLRLNRATQLLKTSSLSIKEIAIRVGINNQRYFARVFAKRFGKTATKYRKED